MRKAVRRYGGTAVRYCAAFACVLTALPAYRLTAQEAERGRAVYDKWCAECHGDDGDGAGAAAPFMLPRPRDFTRALYQIRTTASGEIPTDDDIMRVMDDGMPGTAMPGWKDDLSDQERRDVVAYIKSFSRFFRGAAPEAVAFGRQPGMSDAGLTEGRRLYEELECFKCHGDQGRGDGTSAPTLKDDWDFPIRAADLTKSWSFNGGSSVEDIYRRMRTGLDGTPMPSFSDVIDADIITDEQLWRLAQYVRSLSPDDPPRVREVVRAFLVEGALPADPDDSAWARTEAFYVPLVGQVVVEPRWFTPRVDGVWVRALHNGEQLALHFTWNDPSQSPDPSWQEWVERIAATVTDVDGPIPPEQGADRFHVQVPMRLVEGMDRPYFLGGDTRRPVYQWRWASAPDRMVEGSSTGPDRFVPRTGTAEATHVAKFEDGQWRLEIVRSLMPSDTTAAPVFVTGRAIPIAFFAADGSDGELDLRGSVSTWYAIYLDVPTPLRAYVMPLFAVLITAGLGIMVVWRAQQHGRGSQISSN